MAIRVFARPCEAEPETPRENQREDACAESRFDGIGEFADDDEDVRGDAERKGDHRSQEHVAGETMEARSVFAAINNAMIRRWRHEENGANSDEEHRGKMELFGGARQRLEGLHHHCRHLKAEERLDAGQDHANFGQDVINLVIELFVVGSHIFSSGLISLRQQLQAVPENECARGDGAAGENAAGLVEHPLPFNKCVDAKAKRKREQHMTMVVNLCRRPVSAPPSTIR